MSQLFQYTRYLSYLQGFSEKYCIFLGTIPPTVCIYKNIFFCISLIDTITIKCYIVTNLIESNKPRTVSKKVGYRLFLFFQLGINRLVAVAVISLPIVSPKNNAAMVKLNLYILPLSRSIPQLCI